MSPFFARAGEPATKPASDPNSPYARLATVDGGPDWTMDQIAAQVGPGARLTVDPNNPSSKIDDEPAALRTALDWLAAGAKTDLERAFRLTAATARAPDHKQAARLLTLLYHNGIPSRPDPSAAVRTASKLMQFNDAAACRYVARKNAALFQSLAKPCTKLDELKKMPDATPVKFRAKLKGGSGGAGGTELTVDDGTGKDLKIKSEQTVEDIAAGRVLDVAGFTKAPDPNSPKDIGSIVGLVTSVPKPHVSFKWTLVSAPIVGGTWQTKRVRITIANDGLQSIKKVPMHVRCFVNDGRANDQSTDIAATDLAPGATKTIEASFDMYNYQYIDGVAAPKAEVTAGEMEW